MAHCISAISAGRFPGAAMRRDFLGVDELIAVAEAAHLVEQEEGACFPSMAERARFRRGHMRSSSFHEKLGRALMLFPAIDGTP